MVLKPPEDPSSPLTDSAVRTAHCAGGERPYGHRSRTWRDWWAGDKQPRTTLQTLAGKSISRRQYTQQLHQTTRTHFSHVQAPARARNCCNTLQKLLVLLHLSTHLQNGDKHVPINGVGSYEALYIFSSWNYWYYYNYSKEPLGEEVWERGKKDICEEKKR